MEKSHRGGGALEVLVQGLLEDLLFAGTNLRRRKTPTDPVKIRPRSRKVQRASTGGLMNPGLGSTLRNPVPVSPRTQLAQIGTPDARSRSYFHYRISKNGNASKKDDAEGTAI